MAITQSRIVRIVVEGAVQGVGYRVFVAREAGATAFRRLGAQPPRRIGGDRSSPVRAPPSRNS